MSFLEGVIFGWAASVCVLGIGLVYLVRIERRLARLEGVIEALLALETEEAKLREEK